MVLNGHNGYQPPAQRLAAWLVGYVPANISYLPQGLWPEEGLPTGLATAGADGASNVSLDSGQGDSNGLTRRWSTGSNEH